MSLPSPVAVTGPPPSLRSARRCLNEPLRRGVEDSDSVDPFEALFGMLEEDLKNLDGELLGIDGEDDEDISPEELAKLEKELEAAIGESEELMQLLSMGGEDGGNVIDVGGRSEDDEGEVELELNDWQLKKLAAAAKVGKRRTDGETWIIGFGNHSALISSKIELK